MARRYHPEALQLVELDKLRPRMENFDMKKIREESNILSQEDLVYDGQRDEMFIPSPDVQGKPYPDLFYYYKKSFFSWPLGNFADNLIHFLFK